MHGPQGHVLINLEESDRARQIGSEWQFRVIHNEFLNSHFLSKLQPVS